MMDPNSGQHANAMMNAYASQQKNDGGTNMQGQYNNMNLNPHAIMMPNNFDGGANAYQGGAVSAGG